MPEIEYKPSKKLLESLKKVPSAFPVRWSEEALNIDPALHVKEVVAASLGYKKVGGFSRPVFHLARLARSDRNDKRKVSALPADVERKFAVDFLTYAQSRSDWRINEQRSNVAAKMLDEGLQTNHFWTFAPYLHHKLIQSVPPKESIKIIFKWLEDSIPHAGIYRTLKGMNHDAFNRSFALEPFRSPGGVVEQPYATHKFAASFAAEFAPILLKTYGGKK